MKESTCKRNCNVALNMIRVAHLKHICQVDDEFLRFPHIALVYASKSRFLFFEGVDDDFLLRYKIKSHRLPYITPNYAF